MRNEGMQSSKSTAPLAVFRADADPRIGGGHVTRCLTIAGALARRDWECVFATSASTASTVPLLAGSGHRMVTVGDTPATDAAIIADACNGAANLLVIDHPSYAAPEERALRPAAKRRMAIDGQFRTHDTEVLLDPNPDHDPARLRELTPPDCVILSGAAFIPINAKIAACRPASLTRRADNGHRLNTLLVSLGASDQGPLLAKILEAIAMLDRDCSVTVLAATAVKAVAAAAARLKLDAEILGWQNDVAPLLHAADLVIGAGGTSAWERCCLGVPSLVVTVADNQLAGARFLAAHGAAVDCGSADSVTPSGIAEALRKLDPQALARLSQKASDLVDGHGADRIADAVTRVVASADMT